MIIEHVKRTLRLLDELERFHARFWGIYRRQETREIGLKYLRGLMGSVERKNGWQMAEALGEATPDRMQRFLFGASWDADAARNKLQQFVIDELGDPDGIGIVDETGFLKKGTKSAGVGRQYTGTAGKIENCQIGTFLAYASVDGSVLIDRRLYMPKSWMDDRARCAGAKVPQTEVFQTKPEQARQMLEEAWSRGVPMRWVTGDEVYGNAPELRNAIESAGKSYVLAVSSSMRVRPLVQNKQKLLGNGRKQRATPADADVRTVAEVTRDLRTWERMCVTLGEKGPIIYDWAMLRIHEQVDKPDERAGWLLVRRSVSDPSEMAYYLSNAGLDVLCSTLARVASSRFKIELCFELAKGETGLDHYEARYFHSWHRHITMSMMALAFLVVVCGRATHIESAADTQHEKKRSPGAVNRSRDAQAA